MRASKGGNMKNTAILLTLIMMTSALAGCSGNPFTSDSSPENPDPLYYSESEWFNDSHSFTSMLRTGHMNQYDTDYEGNNSTLTVYLNFTYRFEERPFEQSGYLNLTLEPNNSSGNIYYSQEWSGSEAVVNETIVLTEIYQDVQLRIRAEGSDGSVSGEQQDYYAMQSTYHFVTLLNINMSE